MSKNLIISIVILLIILGAGYLIYQSLTQVSPQKAQGPEVYENNVYGFSINIPESWKGKYFVEEKDNIVSFVYNSNSEMKYEIFSIAVYPIDEWQKIKNEPGFHGTEITSKNGMVFVYSISLDNPYVGGEGEEFQKMAGKVNEIIKTFKLK